MTTTHQAYTSRAILSEMLNEKQIQNIAFPLALFSLLLSSVVLHSGLQESLPGVIQQTNIHCWLKVFIYVPSGHLSALVTTDAMPPVKKLFLWKFFTRSSGRTAYSENDLLLLIMCKYQTVLNSNKIIMCLNLCKASYTHHSISIYFKSPAVSMGGKTHTHWHTKIKEQLLLLVFFFFFAANFRKQKFSNYFINLCIYFILFRACWSNTLFFKWRRGVVRYP